MHARVFVKGGGSVLCDKRQKEIVDVKSQKRGRECEKRWRQGCRKKGREGEGGGCRERKRALNRDGERERRCMCVCVCVCVRGCVCVCARTLVRRCGKTLSVFKKNMNLCVNVCSVYI